jgi:hypothetical protein
MNIKLGWQGKNRTRFFMKIIADFGGDMVAGDQAGENYQNFLRDGACLSP